MQARRDRKSTRLNSSHLGISYAVFCLKKTNNSAFMEPMQASADLHRLDGRGPLPGSEGARWARTHRARDGLLHPMVFFLNRRAPPESPPFPKPTVFLL